MRNRVVFLTPSNVVVYEYEVDARGRCDVEKIALNLLLRGVNTGRAAGKLRIFIEKKGVSSRLSKAVERLGLKIRGDLELTDKDLSIRQREVGVLLCKFASNKQIATDLHITERTVKFHVTVMLRKFGCKNRRELAMRLVAKFAGSDADPPLLTQVVSADLAEARPN